MNIRKYTPTIGALALAGLTGCGGNAFTAVKENLQSARGYDAMVEKLSDKTLILRIGNYEPNNRSFYGELVVADDLNGDKKVDTIYLNNISEGSQLESLTPSNLNQIIEEVLAENQKK